jgi:hypothetical protein
MMRASLVILVCAAASVPAAVAQEFVPPDERGAPRQGTPGMRPGVVLGVIGFSTRFGAQANSDEQGVVGSTIDIAQLGSPLVRLRPSFELGFGRSRTSLHLALEAIFRFQPDEADAIPYVGAGLGYYDDGRVDHLWPNLVMGFELPFRRTFNWLVEYHALDRLGRHRFMVGLATRGGGN